MPPRDSLIGTVLVTAVLCVVCSLAVSSAAVFLRPRQEANEKLDQQINILDATGLAVGEYGLQAKQLDAEQVAELNTWISSALIDLNTGEETDALDIDQYNMLEVADSKEFGVDIVEPEFDLGEQRRPTVMKVYFVTRPGSTEPQQVVLPVYGKGLWGSLYGYLAVKSDLKTVQGLTFYRTKRLRLGGEVDNPLWKKQWEGRKLFDNEGKPASMVFKGPAPSDNPYAVDGLSGATITSRGVTALLRYWTSDDGYGKYLEKLGQSSGNASEG